MKKNQIVYIIGFMGSGKTTAGRKLASSLGWSFIDLDKEIENYSGKSIPRIFEEDGEDSFRKTESLVLRSTVNLSDSIISTGGGTPCHTGNMDFMKENGLTIYLKMTPEQLKQRLIESSGERPLIKNIPHYQLQDYIQKKLNERDCFYNMADLIVQGSNVDYSLLVKLINKYLNY